MENCFLGPKHSWLGFFLPRNRNDGTAIAVGCARRTGARRCSRSEGNDARGSVLKVAAALMEKAKSGDLFAKKPEIHKLDILADKLAK